MSEIPFEGDFNDQEFMLMMQTGEVKIYEGKDFVASNVAEEDLSSCKSD